MKPLLFIISFIFLLFLSSCSTATTPPKFWSIHYKDHSPYYLKKYWKPFTTDKGIDLQRFITYMYEEKTFSQKNNDAMYELAFFLFCIEQDPYNELKNYLKDKDSKKVIYAANVINLLGDRRFLDDLRALKNDDRKIGAHDSSLGEHIERIESSNLYYSLFDDPKLKKYQASWLKDARAIPVEDPYKQSSEQFNSDFSDEDSDEFYDEED